jgi:hypothetical protein
MKDVFNNLLLTTPWFMMVRKNGEDHPEMAFNWGDFIRTIVVALLVAGAGGLITIQVIKNDVGHIVNSANKMEIKVDNLCAKIGSMAEELAVVKTRQEERLEREAMEGIRKHNGTR